MIARTVSMRQQAGRCSGGMPFQASSLRGCGEVDGHVTRQGTSRSDERAERRYISQRFPARAHRDVDHGSGQQPLELPLPCGRRPGRPAAAPSRRGPGPARPRPRCAGAGAGRGRALAVAWRGKQRGARKGELFQLRRQEHREVVESRFARGRFLPETPTGHVHAMIGRASCYWCRLRGSRGTNRRMGRSHLRRARWLARGGPCPGFAAAQPRRPHPTIVAGQRQGSLLLGPAVPPLPRRALCELAQGLYSAGRSCVSGTRRDLGQRNDVPQRGLDERARAANSGRSAKHAIYIIMRMHEAFRGTDLALWRAFTTPPAI